MSDEKKTKVEEVTPEVAADLPETSPAGEEAEKSGSRGSDFIDEPAHVIEDKTKEAARKTSELATQVLGKLKSGITQAIAVGNKVFGEVSEAANHYAEQYKNSAEISRLSSRKDLVIQELGLQYFTLNDNNASTPKVHLADPSIAELISQISGINDEIVRIGNVLEKAKENRK